MTSVVVPAPTIHAGTLVRVLPFVAGLITVAPLAAADGGYFESTWGWPAVGLLWVVAVALVVTRCRPTMLALPPALALAALGLLAVTLDRHGAAALEAERLLVYVAGLSAAAVALRRPMVPPLLGGLLAGIVVISTYSLVTRLYPHRLGTFDPVAGYRLSEPIGYWNGLAIFAALGVLLALGFAVGARSVTARALAAGSTVPLALVMYFTFSRGGWIAFGIGLAAAVGLEWRRASFVTLAVPLLTWPGLAIGFASEREALTSVDAPLALAIEQGGEVALVTLACLVGAVATAVALAFGEARVSIPRRAARAYSVALVGLVVAVLLGVFVRFGTPWTIVERSWDAFSAPPPAATDLNDRLFSFSGSGRVTQWEVALEAWRGAPMTGIGSGGYEAYWLEHRDVAGKIRDAHSLYLETLAELGPLGLALLLLALGVPVYAAFKARGHPLVPAAFGAYVAYLVHAGVDWDWEMPAVTLTALFVGASIVVAARKPEDEEKTMGPRLRYSLLAGTLALAAVAFVGLVGNMALAQSADAARAGDWDKSEREARRAETWAPWSPEPWQRIGEAQLARGELAQARESFRAALEHDGRDWELWLDLARASSGRAQQQALAEATRLNPLSPEIAQLRAELAELGTIEVGG